MLQLAPVTLWNQEYTNRSNGSGLLRELFDTLIKSVEKRSHVKECFHGALNMRYQLSLSDDSDDENTSDTDQDEIERSKWEAIALGFLRLHSEDLTPLLSEDVQYSDPPAPKTNCLHRAVLNSSTTVVKKLIANIQENEYHREHPKALKAMMTVPDSNRRNYLEIALGSDIICAEIVQSLVHAERSLIRQTEKQGVKSAPPLHLFIVETAHRAVGRPDKTRPIPSTDDCCVIVESIIEAEANYILTSTWSGLECELFKDGRLSEHVTPYQLISKICEHVSAQLDNGPPSDRRQRLEKLQLTFEKLKSSVEILIFRYLQGSWIHKAGFGKLFCLSAYTTNDEICSTNTRLDRC